jgi:hypothetical protein
VTELGYHYSIFNTPRTTDDNYYNSPRANISLDGRFVTFTSNWADSGRTDVFIMSIAIPGDANHDGVVAFSDFVSLANNFGAANRGWAGGDFNGDRTTTFADYIILANNFGDSASGPGYVATADELATMEAFAAHAAAIPEPASLALLGIGSIALLTRRGKTRPVA